jgi:ketosteroid isomerase-like protein
VYAILIKDNPHEKIVSRFIEAFDRQDWEAAKRLLTDDFTAYWVTTRERFSKDSFILMNSRYPGRWHLTIQRYESIAEGAVTVALVSSQSEDERHYVTSFYRFREGRISSIEEYWAIEENAPLWRKKYWLPLQSQDENR